MAAGVAGQNKDVVDPWLWLELVEVDDWIEFILLNEHNIGDRLRRINGEAGVGGGTGELQADDETDAKELSSDEKDGAGLTNGLGYGVKFKLLLLRCPPVDPPPLDPRSGFGLLGKRWRHEGDGDR